MKLYYAQDLLKMNLTNDTWKQFRELLQASHDTTNALNSPNTIDFSKLPTSPGSAGTLWVDAGIVKRA